MKRFSDLIRKFQMEKRYTENRVIVFETYLLQMCNYSPFSISETIY
jgi:hypothetical protein